MNPINLEFFDDRVFATYETKDKLYQAKVILRKKLGLNDKHLEVIPPATDNISETLEGKSEQVAKSMFSLHFKYPMIGLALGFITALVLVLFGPALFTNSPLFTFIAFLSPGIFLGAFYAGLRSLKPERDAVNLSVVSASQKHNWTLLVQTEEVSVSKQAIIEELQSTQSVDVSQSE